MPLSRLYCSGNKDANADDSADDNADVDGYVEPDADKDEGGCELVLNLNLDCSF